MICVIMPTFLWVFLHINTNFKQIHQAWWLEVYMNSVFVKSSDPELCYELKIEDKGSWVKVTCECQAYNRELLCKHQLAVMECDFSMLFYQAEKDSMRDAYETIQGSNLPNVLAEIREQENIAKFAQNNTRNLKRKLARMMRKGGE